MRELPFSQEIPVDNGEDQLLLVVCLAAPLISAPGGCSPSAIPSMQKELRRAVFHPQPKSQHRGSFHGHLITSLHSNPMEGIVVS
jgi:hypothetical protein